MKKSYKELKTAAILYRAKAALYDPDICDYPLWLVVKELEYISKNNIDVQKNNFLNNIMTRDELKKVFDKFINMIPRKDKNV